ncbi:hypothetical protein [Agrobacterium tumefaciens]|uniref:hypothetical protein n=1 Tax=Agrobacterium tumefaciens TaxID=358 RepID=UPI00157360B7|nr:hypothetical protein [Agrobacterium tumefaciens]NSX90643.1 hypothetical protein [Agrobacterium tumefaciens]
MFTILVWLGVLQMIGGAIVAFTAKSAMHEIIAVIAFGMGTMALGLSKVVDLLEGLRDDARKKAD